jgi:hypothetical protein
MNTTDKFWSLLNQRTRYFVGMNDSEKTEFIKQTINLGEQCDYNLWGHLFEFLSILVKVAPMEMKDKIAFAIISKKKLCQEYPIVISSFCNAIELTLNESSTKLKEQLSESIQELINNTTCKYSLQTLKHTENFINNNK